MGRSWIQIQSTRRTGLFEQQIPWKRPVGGRDIPNFHRIRVVRAIETDNGQVLKIQNTMSAMNYLR